jgi:hypothetical protein
MDDNACRNAAVRALRRIDAPRAGQDGERLLRLRPHGTTRQGGIVIDG